jgi:3D-(3,5/4)-trihydroxycyclohexane-1,2-dione acylhydrolase (decyclizing)
VAIARPDEDVLVMVGDGSYLMMNSEIVSAVMMGVRLTIVVLDNAGFGCINRLQMATGGANFNNLFRDTYHMDLPNVDFAAHCRRHGRQGEEGGGRWASWRRHWRKARAWRACMSWSSTPIR